MNRGKSVTPQWARITVSELWGFYDENDGRWAFTAAVVAHTKARQWILRLEQPARHSNEEWRYAIPSTRHVGQKYFDDPMETDRAANILFIREDQATSAEWIDQFSDQCASGTPWVIGTCDPLRVHVSETTTLYRPLGPKELELVAESGYNCFPPRLPEQPFFYPVVNLEYAEEIASKWNVRDDGIGYVAQFEVDRDFLSRYEIHQAGNRTHLEYWIPAEELDEFNERIVGKIRIVRRYPAVEGSNFCHLP